MATYSQTLEPRKDISLATRDALIHEVRQGLRKRPRSLSPWILYDERGSQLFDRITTLPEYYPTRTERSILARNADAIIASVLSGPAQPLRIVELGAGSASKTGILLKAAIRARADVLYMPLDVSPEALDTACQSLDCLYPEVQVEPNVVNYITHPPRLNHFPGATLMLYLGSSIGNFSPEESRTILRNAASQMRTGDAFLLGADLVKDESTLVAAYDDRAGVTAAFNVNILHRLNRELDANFDPSGFQHRARWNASESRIEMHLESRRDQQVSISAAQMDLHFERGETIHSENSYKFTDWSVSHLLKDAGFGIRELWKDEEDRYSVVLAGASSRGIGNPGDVDSESAGFAPAGSSGVAG